MTQDEVIVPTSPILEVQQAFLSQVLPFQLSYSNISRELTNVMSVGPCLYQSLISTTSRQKLCHGKAIYLLILVLRGFCLFHSRLARKTGSGFAQVYQPSPLPPHTFHVPSTHNEIWQLITCMGSDIRPVGWGRQSPRSKYTLLTCVCLWLVVGIGVSAKNTGTIPVLCSQQFGGNSPASLISQFI